MAEHKTDSVMVASHIVLLTRVFDKSQGDVLELGTGYFSTLLLHWLATVAKRRVVSYETQKHWYERARRWQSEFHDIVFCRNLDEADFDQRHWGMVFIDHGPNSRRPTDIRRLADKCDYMVIHDTPPEWDDRYGYSAIWPLFKYRYDYAGMFPPTTVVSNFKDLSDIP
jgi:tRNA A58 N-methylase Trm61